MLNLFFKGFPLYTPCVLGLGLPPIFDAINIFITYQFFFLLLCISCKLSVYLGFALFSFNKILVFIVREIER